MRRGFTLIELLVVIAIIAILAAILFPVFAKAREKARQSSCLSNTKQLCLAILQYSQDYDENFPMGRWWQGSGTWYGWDTSVAPYIKNTQIFRCPSNPAVACSYGTTCSAAYTAMGGLNTPQPIGKIYYPAEMYLIVDGSPNSFMHVPKNAWPTVCACADAVAPWPHNEGTNVGYCDGHGKWQAGQSVVNNVRLWRNVP